MEQFILCLMSLAVIFLGIFMATRPITVILHDRDQGEETRPPTSGEIRLTRIVGLALIAAGVYIFYAILTGQPGAEFFPC